MTDSRKDRDPRAAENIWAGPKWVRSDLHQKGWFSIALNGIKEEWGLTALDSSGNRNPLQERLRQHRHHNLAGSFKMLGKCPVAGTGDQADIRGFRVRREGGGKAPGWVPILVQ